MSRMSLREIFAGAASSFQIFSVQLQQHIYAGTAVHVGACVCMRVHVMAYVWERACV
jgi:hypothetical protein